MPNTSLFIANDLPHIHLKIIIARNCFQGFYGMLEHKKMLFAKEVEASQITLILNNLKIAIDAYYEELPQLKFKEPSPKKFEHYNEFINEKFYTVLKLVTEELKEFSGFETLFKVYMISSVNNTIEEKIATLIKASEESLAFAEAYISDLFIYADDESPKLSESERVKIDRKTNNSETDIEFLKKVDGNALSVVSDALEAILRDVKKSKTFQNRFPEQIQQIENHFQTCEKLGEQLGCAII